MNNKYDKGIGIHARRAIAYVVLVLISFLCLFWFYSLFINATRSHSDLTRGFSFVPGDHLVINFKNIVNCELPVVSGMINSFIIAISASFICSYFSVLTAYGIHAYRFRGRNLIYGFMLAFMMIPRQITALGFVDMIRDMNLMDSFLPLILPEIAAPVVFFYMIKYMESNLRMSLVEAARIDGSSEIRTFNRIVLPLMKPAFAVQMIFKFVESWNNYFIPALILKSDERKTMPIVIALMRSSHFIGQDNGKVYMMIAFSILPAIVIYIFLSRFIISGITSGGEKG